MTWRSIATAPKEPYAGILLFCAGMPDGYRQICTGFWSPTWKRFVADAFMDSGGGMPATHWMPFPEPPSMTALSPFIHFALRLADGIDAAVDEMPEPACTDARITLTGLSRALQITAEKLKSEEAAREARLMEVVG